ncbi:MAG TPA: tetratricopeptide repeat protein [Polyangia bacterium]|nr:tetratricopeptide repeat protein [Polyangia bacterium]
MAALRRPFSFLFVLVAVVVGVQIATTAVAAAGPAAGDPATIAKVTNLNKKALEAYNQQDYDTARDLLKQALELCSSAGMDQHPITARTHVHFGVVAIVGFKQREVGLKQFRKALEIEPDIKLTKSLVTPELQDAFEEAVLAGNAKAGGAAAGGDDQGNAGGENAAAGGDDNQGGPTATGSDEGDEDHPKPRPKPRKKKSDEDEDNKEEEGAGQKGTIFLGLTIGSSAGVASGNGHMNPAHQLSAPGFAVGQLGQIEPQIGYFVNSTTLLSLVGRLQYVTGLNGENLCGANGTTFCNPLTIVGAVLARATFLMSDGPFRFTVGGQVGGGYVAHALVFPSDTKCGSSMSTAGNTQCVDALLGGAFLIGPTVGVFYELGDTASIIAGINTELGAPKFTFNFDLDVGIAFRL